jgi:uncharacterized protein YfaP (DUF2135 family)
LVSSSTTGAPTGSGEARLVVSWDQPEEDVDLLSNALAALACKDHPQ